MENEALIKLKEQMIRKNSKKVYSSNPEGTLSFYNKDGNWVTREERFQQEYTIEDVPQSYDVLYEKRPKLLKDARTTGIFLTIIANIPKKLKLTRIKELTPYIRNRFAGKNFDDRKFKMDLITKQSEYVKSK